jgi:hypothetical protein
MREEDLWDMSDDELEAAFKEAQAADLSPDTDLEDTQALEEFPESEPSMEDPDEEVSLDEEDTEEEFEDGPEQPEDDLEDSGHDASDESDTDEVAEEDDSETDEDDPDEDSEEDEEPSSDDAEDEDEEEQPVQTYKFKANGKDYEFSSEEIVDQFPKIFGQAMDYTKKMQAIKPWRKTIDAIEGAELNHDDVSLMIDVLKGDKGAITEVLKRTGVDTLELDTDADNPYVAKDYGRDDSALAIKDIVDDISRDQEYATTHNILSKEWDDRSWNTMAQNPEMIRLLHTDVKSGMYETLQPLAEKLKVYDGGKKSDLDYYKEAAQQHFNQVAEQDAYEERQAAKQAEREAKEAEKARLAEVKAQSQKRTATKQASAKRKAAAPSKATASRDVIDYLDDSDEAFDDWYQRLQESM